MPSTLDAPHLADLSLRPGTQFTSGEFAALLDHHYIHQSLSRPRQCWTTSWRSHFSRPTDRALDCQPWPIRAQARRATVEFIEVFTRGCILFLVICFPAQYEAGIRQHKEVQAA
jgi:hypothetical protein